MNSLPAFLFRFLVAFVTTYRKTFESNHFFQRLYYNHKNKFFLRQVKMLDQLIGQTLSDKYRIEDVLRDGGASKIYRGTHLLMEKPVTLKILSPAFAADENAVKQFSAEARTLSLISHPNILNVTDFGSDRNGAIYLALENADGVTVKEALRREGQFSPERAVRIALQTAAALAAAHAGGVVHRHLSSENIFLTSSANEAETVKVLNFGSADAIGNGRNGGNISTADVEYLSPEQCSGASAVDARSDVYSLGVVLYEMLAGEVPFRGEKPSDIADKQAHEPPAPLSAFRHDLPAGVEPIVLQALAKNPEMRFQSAQEFARVLNHAAQNFGGTETVFVPQEDETVNNNVWKTAFLVLAGIVLLSGAFIYATSVKQTNPTTQLQTDANGMPVQPLNPATGASEQGLSNMMTFSPEMMGNSSVTAVPPSGEATYPDGVNPWASGGRPPAGAPMPYPVAPGGQMIDPNNPNSPFMQDGTVYVPVPVNPNANANVNANAKPAATPAGKATPLPANTQPAATPNNPASPPAANTKPNQSAPKTDTPAKPVEKPKATPPATTEKQVPSGKQQDSL